MSQAEHQEQAIEHEELMALHEANARQQRDGKDSHGQARLLDQVVESELETGDAGLENLKAKDFPLSNYDQTTDTIEFKWLQEIYNAISKARHPHPKSGLYGLARAWASGDPGDRLQPLKLDEFARDETYLMGTYSRAKRGVDMAQQETSAKSVNESVAIRQGGRSKKGGLRGKVKRWRG